MKKILLIVILLLGLGGAGAGYYLFFMKPQSDTEVTKMTDDTKAKSKASDAKTQKVAKPVPFRVKDYYIKERKIAVRNGPGDDHLPERYMYIGDTVRVLEQKDGWGRISNFYVYKEGGKEMAEWVKMSDLSHTKPIISPLEHDDIVSSYIGRSDDFKLYRDRFIKVTSKLLQENICKPEDFEELHGWMRSLNYPDRNVYFVYCGGLNVSDKVYYDVDSGEVFYK
ncbi:hypothetical protein [Vibrio salinus]|uniref:hypothetical protein n=1 Tax=Vibrio salinus TaxID=2899784 RepID=UPI001E513F2A|nr:hypothetical protein [Vibrio salinus]MCE0496014.1 hypothetical protein [Vibrio salinus]